MDWIPGTIKDPPDIPRTPQGSSASLPLESPRSPWGSLGIPQGSTGPRRNPNRPRGLPRYLWDSLAMSGYPEDQTEQDVERRGGGGKCGTGKREGQPPPQQDAERMNMYKHVKLQNSKPKCRHSHLFVRFTLWYHSENTSEFDMCRHVSIHQCLDISTCSDISIYKKESIYIYIYIWQRLS